MGDYVVHSRHDTTAGVPAKMEDGTLVQAELPTAIIELVPCDSTGETQDPEHARPHPTRTLHRRIDSEQALTALELVQPGAIIRFTESISVVKEAPPPPPVEDEAETAKGAE